MKEITLNVPQGLGDIFWIYQKFANHADKINFNIMHYGHGDPAIQLRTLPWLKLLPKAGVCQPVEVTSARYERVWRSVFDMRSIFIRAERGYLSADYGCNHPLEQGIRLEDIDRVYSVQEAVPLAMQPYFAERRYVVAYVSGAAGHPWAAEKGVWGIDPWVALVVGLMKRFGIKAPVVALGAEYDAMSTKAFADKLKTHDVEVVPMIGCPPDMVAYVISRSICFIGFQSGLNVIADNAADVPQVMVYLASLDKLRYSWPRTVNIKSGRYNAFLFTDQVEQIVEGVRWKM